METTDGHSQQDIRRTTHKDNDQRCGTLKRKPEIGKNQGGTSVARAGGKPPVIRKRRENARTAVAGARTGDVVCWLSQAGYAVRTGQPHPQPAWCALIAEPVHNVRMPSNLLWALDLAYHTWCWRKGFVWSLAASDSCLRVRSKVPSAVRRFSYQFAAGSGRISAMLEEK